MLSDWHFLAGLLALVGLVNGSYLIAIFGRTHYVFSARLIVLGSFTLLLLLLISLVDGTHPKWALLNELAAHLDRAIFHYDLPAAGVSAVLEFGALTSFCFLLFAFFSPIILRHRISRAIERGNRLAAARLMRTQARMFGGELGRNIRLGARYQSIASEEGVLVATEEATRHFAEAALGHRSPSATDNSVANLLAEAGAWKVLDLFPPPVERRLERKLQRSIVPLLVHVARARLEQRKLPEACDELEAICSLSVAPYWSQGLKWVVSRAQQVAREEGASDVKQLRRMEDLLAQTENLAKYLAPNCFPSWLIALLSLQGICFLALGFVSNATQREIIILFANRPFESWDGLEVWRLFTHTFIHLNIGHFLFNGFVLFLFGRSLHRLVGAFRSIAIFLFGAMAGGMLSAIFGGYSYGIGASTAAMAVYGFWLLSFLFYALKKARHWLNYVILSGVVVVGAQLGFDYLNPQTDFYGHLGGLLAGALAYALHSRDESRNKVT